MFLRTLRKTYLGWQSCTSLSLRPQGGRGVKFTSARVLVRAPIDGPGFPMRTARARRKLRNSSESLLHVGGQRHQTHVRLLKEKRSDFEVVLLETAVLSMEKISMICSTSLLNSVLGNLFLDDRVR